MENSATPRPERLPGYDGGPLTHRPELLDQPLFWWEHLYSSVREEEAEDLLFGADPDAVDDFRQQMGEEGAWPVFTVPLAAGRLHVVHRIDEDPGIDFLVHRPEWAQAELVARLDGHFMGPGLSWSELVAAADSALAGGSTDDPDCRLLLLLPALGDSAVPDGAVERLAAALRPRTGVEDPDGFAVALLEQQEPWGPVRWTTGGDGSRINDGGWSPRNPGNRALSPARLARVSAALAPDPGSVSPRG
ncbi:hypothetical protein [Nocardiopsis sp. FIRDI 009]|uniref:hypothetical protein n=1 Tax=Nocardiopsis sp. FIRDI 009 TaxID=714197 RepID=UPI001E34181B|nr:hypothetical protein [Nocardiopsis sp. FIRDI 009]